MEQQFVFTNQAGDISTFLHKVLDCLAAQPSIGHNGSALLFKAKFILGELLNNAVKHSGTRESIFKLSVDKDAIQISKIDDGPPMPQLKTLEHAKAMLISTDAIFNLLAEKRGEGFRFTCEEAAENMLEPSHISEHMGLLIITRAADEFTYQYQPPRNIFTARLNLG